MSLGDKIFKTMSLFYLILSVLFVTSFAQNSSEKDVELKVKNLLSKMTIEEKIGQMTQVTVQVISEKVGSADSETVFDPVKRKMTYSGAGHPRPLLLRRKTDTIDFLRSKGFFLGMFEGAEYTDTTIDFTRGDRYLVYTDGIIEAYSEEKKKQFGSKKLLRGFEMYRNKPIDILLNSIISDVKKFMKKSQFYDDLAMVAVEYK